jgi:hypothetical protein
MIQSLWDCRTGLCNALRNNTFYSTENIEEPFDFSQRVANEQHIK